MKKIIYYFLTLLMIGFIQSCTHEEDDIFEDSSANRINKAVEEYRDILTNAPNGWLMEYYAEKEPRKMGGYNILCKFDKDGQVTLAAEFSTSKHAIAEKVTSWYQVIPNQGPVLTFDTYNEIIHRFSTPSSSDFNGNEGDFEFVFMEVSQDRIVLNGKKSKLNIILTRNSESLDWDTYLQEINEVIDATEIYSLFKVELDGTEIASCSMTTNRLYTFTIGDETILQNAIYTLTGIKFYEPLDLGGKAVRNFRWNEEDKSYVCEDGINMVLKVHKLPNYLYYEEFIGSYSLKYISDYLATGSEKRRNVKIEEDVKGVSYLLTGDFDWPIKLGYDRTKGCLTLAYQQVSTSSSGTPIVLWAFNGVGSLYETEIMNGVFNGDTENPEINIIRTSAAASGFAIINRSDKNYLTRDSRGDFALNNMSLTPNP